MSCAYKRFRRRPGAFKVDFAVESGVPWTNPAAGRAGTVDVAGAFAELAAAHAGAAVRVGWSAVPGRPAPLNGQHSSGVDVRSRTERIFGDATAAIIGQIERFAPVFRERIVGQTRPDDNANGHIQPKLPGGDIMTGSKDLRQLTFGPRMTLPPYEIGAPGMYICSAATPPGPGAHGMCGASVAEIALASRRRSAH